MDQKIRKNTKQLKLLEKNLSFSGLDSGTTFKKNASFPIHRWYSYVEGFSWNFVRKILQSYSKKDFIVLDPFCGSGTSLVECCNLGIRSIGYDVNPFLTFVSDVKTDFSINVKNIISEVEILKSKFQNCNITRDVPTFDKVNLSAYFANNNAFGKDVLPKVLFVKKCLNEIRDTKVRNFFILAFCSIIIVVSNYRRGPDLALKREKLKDFPVFERFLEQISIMIEDLNKIKKSNFAKPKLYTGDSRFLEKIENDSIDLVITSPPYLNGTNYFRNTKLELWFTEMLTDVNELHNYREKAITAGINDAFKSKYIETTIPNVKKVFDEISKSAYDSRIPIMVSTYFEEISLCLQNLFRVMKSDSKCYWVIGDSAFSKIHVPTDKLTVEVAEKNGFKHEITEIVRRRKSRSGFDLHEAVITLKKTD